MFWIERIHSLNLNTNFVILVGNQASYCGLNLPHRVTRTTDSNYLPMEGRKNENLTFYSRIWLGNFFPITRDQSSRNETFCKR